MKKVLGLLLAFCMVFSLCACKDKEKEDAKTAVIDLKYYSSLGKMPECEYALGYDAEKLIEYYEGEAEKHEGEHTHAFVFNVYESDDYTEINTGDFTYYYRNDDKEKKVSCIVNYSAAYKFETGSLITQVKNSLTKFKVEEKECDMEDIFFLPAGGKCSLLTYKFETGNIAFVFIDNALTATVIYNPEEWSL